MHNRLSRNIIAVIYMYECWRKRDDSNEINQSNQIKFISHKKSTKIFYNGSLTIRHTHERSTREAGAYLACCLSKGKEKEWKENVLWKYKLKNKSDKHQSSIIITINNYDNSSSNNNNNNNNNNKTSTASFTTATIKLVLFMVQKHHIDSGRFGHLVSPPGTSSAPANGPGHHDTGSTVRWHRHRYLAPADWRSTAGPSLPFLLWANLPLSVILQIYHNQMNNIARLNWI